MPENLSGNRNVFNRGIMGDLGKNRLVVEDSVGACGTRGDYLSYPRNQARYGGMVRLSAKWSELEESYEQLWNGLTSIQEKTALAAYKRLKDSEVKLKRDMI